MENTQLIQSLLRDISEETKNTITQLKSDISNAYTSISDKGGTLPEEQNAGNLAEAIESIPSGADPNEVDLTNYFTGTKIQNVYIKTPIISFSNRTLPYCIIENLHMEDVTQVTVTGLLGNISTDNLYIPNLEIVRNDFGIRLNINNSHVLDAPKLTTIGMWFMQYSNIRKAYIPSLLGVNGGGAFANCTDLICIETGGAFTGNVGLQAWSPTNALKNDDSSLVEAGEPFANNLEKFLYNIRTYLAANLNSQVTATITFSANVYNAIQADPTTVAAFPASWTIASA